MESSTGGKTVGEGGEAPLLPKQPAPIPNANAPPPFLVKTYDMVDDPSTDKIVSWSPSNNSFVVWNPPEFARDLLPKYFKHSNFSSFVRQLNTYGFRKVDPDRWEFANEGFLRGQRHLLKNITRRKPAHAHSQQSQQPHTQNSSVGACVEVGKFGLEEDVEWLKRDKNVLMQELVRLRQQQQATDNQLQTMVQRLQGMEQRQQQMMSFLAKAVNNPGFLAQFMQQQNESSRRISEGNKKRRIKQEGLNGHADGPADGQIVKYQPLMNEAAKALLMRITKINASPLLESFSNSPDECLIGDGSSSSDALDSANTSNHISGVTFQEVQPNTGQSFVSASSIITSHDPPAMSEIQSSDVGTSSENVQFSDVNPLSGPLELPSVILTPTDIAMPELSQLQEILPESSVDIMGPETGNGMFLDPTSLSMNGKSPLEIGSFSPDPEIEWDNTLLDGIQELPSVSDPFWEKFLAQSPQDIESEMDSTAVDDPSKGNEMNSSPNGLDKTQNMEQLTEQMELLTSDTKKV